MNIDLFQNRPASERGHSCPPRVRRRTTAFTLIELLVVIAIIAILAALIFPVVGAVKKIQVRSRANSELRQLETAIETYKTKLGFYPPSDTNYLVPNSLFYELVGTTAVMNNNNPIPMYTTTDRAFSLSANDLPNLFGSRVGGFMNCTRGSGDEGVNAQKFLVDLKPNQYLEVTNLPPKPPTPEFVVLGTMVADGPVVFTTDEEAPRKINPWRYNSAKPVHNAGSFDLWIDVKIGNKVYRVNNWGQEYVVNPASANYWP